MQHLGLRPPGEVPRLPGEVTRLSGAVPSRLGEVSSRLGPVPPLLSPVLCLTLMLCLTLRLVLRQVLAPGRGRFGLVVLLAFDVESCREAGLLVRVLVPRAVPCRRVGLLVQVLVPALVQVSASELDPARELVWRRGSRRVEPASDPVRPPACRLGRLRGLRSVRRLGRPRAGRNVEGRCRAVPGPATGRSAPRVTPRGSFRSVVSPRLRLLVPPLARPRRRPRA